MYIKLTVSIGRSKVKHYELSRGSYNYKPVNFISNTRTGNFSGYVDQKMAATGSPPGRKMD